MKTAVRVGGVPSAESIIMETDDPDIVAFRQSAPKAEVDRYFEINRPYDAIRYVPHAAPLPLFFQFARYERTFTEAAMKRYFDAASDPKTVRWYATGHDLNDLRVVADRAAWLERELGLRPTRALPQKRPETELLKASGQLDQLAAAFTRLDPPRIGIRREVGPLLLVKQVVDSLQLVRIIDGQIPQRGRAELTTGEVIAALVANRLCAPAPLYDIAAWGSGSALQELLGVPGMLLNDDRLGRALEAFAPVAETVRGEVALAAIEAFGADAARLHRDLTTLRVAGAYEASSLVGEGWGSDRRVARQVRERQAANPQ